MPNAPKGLAGLGEFIRSQRRLANLSVRELARLARVSNPYLSQIERGIYEPSARVLKSIADALHISAEALFTQAGFLGQDEDVRAGAPSVEVAVRLDPRLSDAQKEALLDVYRNFVTEPDEGGSKGGADRRRKAPSRTRSASGSGRTGPRG